MTYTVEEARRILKLDPDFSSDTIQEYIDSADAKLKAATGKDFPANPNALSKKFVRLSMLQEHYNPVGLDSSHDFSDEIKDLLTRLSLIDVVIEGEPII